jgi:hypothetical protein
LNLYAIGVENSTTITYNWKTTEYQDITGTMRIYRCRFDGTKDLVEAIPITGGVATANIELLTAQYAYDVIIDGTTYQQESFYTCHVESSTERTFFVDITEVSLAPAIGLYMIDCTLEKLNSSEIYMRWMANSESSEPITGCLVGMSSDINGSNEFYRNCTNSSLSLTRLVPDPGVTYTVRGYLYQGGVQGYCRQDITINYDQNAALTFGPTLLFSIMLLVIGMTLFYAGRSTTSLMGAGLAVVIAWGLGLLALPWTWVTLVIAILTIVGVVIRFGRSGR